MAVLAELLSYLSHLSFALEFNLFSVPYPVHSVQVPTNSKYSSSFMKMNALYDGWDTSELSIVVVKPVRLGKTV